MDTPKVIIGVLSVALIACFVWALSLQKKIGENIIDQVEQESTLEKSIRIVPITRAAPIRPVNFTDATESIRRFYNLSGSDYKNVPNAVAINLNDLFIYLHSFGTLPYSHLIMQPYYNTDQAIPENERINYYLYPVLFTGTEEVFESRLPRATGEMFFLNELTRCPPMCGEDRSSLIPSDMPTRPTPPPTDE